MGLPTEPVKTAAVAMPAEYDAKRRKLGEASPGASCDLVVLGRIFTGVGTDPWASGLAACSGRITYVGSEEGALACACADARVLREQPLVMPGFHDAHCHPFGAGLRLNSSELKLAGLDVAAIGEELRRMHLALPAGEVITGSGINWNTPMTEPAAFIERHAPGRVVVLSDGGGHAAWASQAALHVMPFTVGNKVQLPDGAVGKVVTISDNGSAAVHVAGDADGVRHCDAAALRPAPDESFPVDAEGASTGYIRNPWKDQLVNGVRVKLSPEAMAAALRRGLREAVAQGITAIQDAFVPAGRTEVYCDVYSAALSDHEGLALPRMTICLAVRPSDWESRGETLERLQRERAMVERLQEFSACGAAPHFMAQSIKVEVDAPPSKGLAWMLSAYAAASAKSAPCGEPFGWTEEALSAAIRAATDLGFDIHAHVMGDAAARFVLDLLSEAEQRRGAPVAGGRVHTLAHLLHLDPADVPRFVGARACALFTPQWMHGAHMAGVSSAEHVGRERAERLTPARELLRAGQAVAFGSDWDVVPDVQLGLSPLAGLECAVTHRLPGSGEAGPCGAGGWQPDGRLELGEAVRLQTIGAARAMGLAEHTGTLEVGKRADLVLLDKDIFRLPPAQIASARVMETLVDGRRAFIRRERRRKPTQP